MPKFPALILFLLLLGFKGWSQTFTITGVVQDSASAESLPRASLQVEGTRYVTQANAYGQFSMRLPKGDYSLAISFVGYNTQTVSIHINSNRNIVLLLSPSVMKLDEVEVRAASVVSDLVPGRHKLSMEQILKQPAFAGEADVLKSLQFLPGVKSPSEATTNIAVRGGSYDQTLILLDGAPVYNSAHALGFFSTFNADAVKDVELYKGLMPVRYGNRLSSVVDIRMREGNVNKYQAKLGVGLIASRLTIEGPIQKGVSSFIVSGRYSYAGNVLNGLGKVAQAVGLYAANDFVGGNKVNFYDFNAKMNFKDKSGRNRLYVSGYSGHDKFNYYILQAATLMDWGNQTGSFQWNRFVNDRLSMVTSGTYSHYGYHYQVVNDSRRFDWNAGQHEVNLKTEFDYAVSPAYSINFGAHLMRNNNQPGRIEPLSETAVVKPYRLDTKRSVIQAVFIENLYNPTRFLKISAGFRQSFFALMGPVTAYEYLSTDRLVVSDSTVYGKLQFAKTYSALEPRVGLTLLLSEKSSFKASWNRTVQYTHLLTNSSVGLPTDIWVPSSNNTKPQNARQATLGFYQSTTNNRYSFTLEGYYKKMKNVIDFVDNADLFVNKNIETQILTGTGLAYGLESMIAKQAGRFKYQISYTWSKTSRKIAGINNDNPYPTRDDRRHALAITSLCTFPKKRTEFSANFVMNSGAPITMPTNTFYYQGALFYEYDGRNQYRLPIYHRLDISLIVHKKPKGSREGSWIFSIHNVYDRKNVFSAVSRTEDWANFQLYSVVGLAPFGIVPSITYNLAFK
ncbi:TonB-dependent receptor [Dyadobacter sp. 32]|uniref:TonB-dependent receptor n=1 Tax=Dyadobacter sp. 32 TaxID=538966 RepID=UPI0011EFC47A